ncbi:MAG: hypothetical protein LQ339_005938 [Xanthoria mediterranea]|nr:MAG: hypothetical protein LQ339_005938 [Xanthoria mediterranea]
MEADEKLHNSSNHGSDTDAPSRSDLDDDPVYSYKEQRAIIHRIDRRLVVTLGLMYCMSQIDRATIGNASIAGLNDDLALNVGYRLSIIFLVFSPTYIIFQPPATVLTRKLGPRKFLGTIMLLWGATEIVRITLSRSDKDCG